MINNKELHDKLDKQIRDIYIKYHKDLDWEKYEVFVSKAPYDSLHMDIKARDKDTKVVSRIIIRLYLNNNYTNVEIIKYINTIIESINN